ncbi:MFS transporter [Paraburkholderia terrae]|nr:MFS transporter [Paraburkholderia terrae]
MDSQTLPAEAAPAAIERPSLRVLFPALLLVMLLAALDQTIVSTALPTIVGELGGLDSLSWVVTAYLLTSTIVVPLYGKFGDLFGRKVVLQTAIVLFLIVPLGIVALLVIGAVFKPRVAHVKHTIDYMGAAFLAGALTCLILFTSQGGTVLPWTSPQLWGTLLLAFICIGGFIYEERLAVEPIMPLELFRDRTFLLSSAIGFIVGVSLFGSVTFLPMYLQVVKNSTPSEAGMQMLPMMGGVLLMSIITGRIISRIGKYRMFPIMGTFLVGVAMVLLTTLKLETPVHVMYAYMGVLGCGLGMVMQVLILAVQNAVPFKHLGTATSGATLFRSIGGSVGVAAFGAIFSNGLASRLQALIPPDTELPHALGPAAIHHLPAVLRDDYLQAFASALHTVYVVAACVVVLAFALAWLLRDHPLRKQ